MFLVLYMCLSVCLWFRHEFHEIAERRRLCDMQQAVVCCEQGLQSVVKIGGAQTPFSTLLFSFVYLPSPLKLGPLNCSQGSGGAL